MRGRTRSKRALSAIIARKREGEFVLSLESRAIVVAFVYGMVFLVFFWEEYVIVIYFSIVIF